MGGKYTAAQKKATETYQKTLSSISIRIKKEDYTRIKAGAAAAGVSLRDFVLTSVDEKIKRGAAAGSDPSGVPGSGAGSAADPG